MTLYDDTQAGMLINAAPINDVGVMVEALLNGLLVPSIQYAGFASLLFMVGWHAFRGLTNVSG